MRIDSAALLSLVEKLEQKKELELIKVFDDKLDKALSTQKKPATQDRQQAS